MDQIRDGRVSMLRARRIAAFLIFVLFSLPLLARGEKAPQESPLPLLEGLEPSVEFWRQVFTRYGASQVLLHDTQDPRIIYKVLELGDDRRARRVIGAEIENVNREHGFDGDDNRVRAQRGVRERFAAGLKTSGKYLEQMQEIFREHGLPPELAYLPLVESAFNVHARSRAGAVGMWQFMRSTGRKYLRISRLVDERKDPLESTRAAARFLKGNYEALGNWPLAITAYNHGREGIQRAISEVGSTDLMEIIRRYEGRYFGFASKSFYAEFLAAVEVAKNSEEFFPELDYHSPLPLEEVEVRRSVSVASLLKRTDISLKEFLEWNPALHRRIRSIPSGYRIKIPSEKLEGFLNANWRVLGKPAPSVRSASTTAKSDTEDGSYISHRVKRGETLSKIARQYQTSTDEIERVNGLDSVHLISVGQRLRIPTGNASASGEHGGKAASYVRHRVKRGETLWEIAQQYQITIREIQRLNRLRSIHYLSPGQSLRIPIH